MRRFLIDPACIDKDSAVITGNLFRHMVRVLRLKTGTAVELSDGTGKNYRGVILHIEKESVTVRVEKEEPENLCMSGPAITLIQGLPKGDKMELILQKTTELGLHSVIPFAADRSVPKLEGKREAEKVERWRRVVREAARQSNRTSAPEVFPVGTLDEIVEASRHDVKILLWEQERDRSLRTELMRCGTPGTVAVLVGPEGGLTEEEAEKAIDGGFIPVTMGRLILRTETAAIAIVSIMQFFWGNMGE